MNKVKSIRTPKITTLSFNEVLAQVVARASKEIKEAAEKAGKTVDVIIHVIPTTTKEGGIYGGQ